MVDIGQMFSKSWERFSSNIGMAILFYLVGGIVGGLIGAFTLGILGIPVFAGMYKGFRKLQKGQEVEFSDLFSEFSNLGRWFMLWVALVAIGLALGIINSLLMLIVIGVITAPLSGILLAIFLFFVVMLMLEKDMDAFPAIKESFNKVKSHFGDLILPILLNLVVMGLFAIITAPWMMIAAWDIYDAAYEGAEPAPAPAPEPPPVDE